MKFLKKLFLILLIVLVVLLLGRNVIAKIGAEVGTNVVLGLKLRIQKINIGLFSTKFHIKGLTLYNPKGFEEPVMVDLPELLIDYNLIDIIGGTIHLKQIIFDLKEVNIVKNADGETNIDVFKPKEGKEKAAEPKEEPKEPKEKSAMPEIQIDEFDLRIGTLAFKTYKEGQADPAVNEIKLNMDEHYEDVTNPQVIAAIIAQKVFRNAAFNSIPGFDMNGFEDAIGGTLGNVDELAGQALGSAADLSAGAIKAGLDVTDGALKAGLDVTDGAFKAVGGVGDTAGQTAEKAEELAKETGTLLKEGGEKLKGLLPFGKE